MERPVTDGGSSVPALGGAVPGERANAEQPAPATDERFFRDALGVPSDEFLQNIAGQRAYGPHASAARLQAADLVAMADIDYMLNQPQLDASDVHIIRDGGANPQKRAVTARGAVDVAYIYGEFAKGYSLRLLAAHRCLPPVAGFAAEIAAALGEHVGANLYLTPASGGGLMRHYDSHDVLVLQCIGSKRWRLYADDYANGRERPTGRAYNFDPRLHRVVGPIDREVDMTPGDVLYLPRGIVHEVVPPTDDSLHVTFDIHTLTVGELASRALRLAAKKAEGLRAPIPHALRLGTAVDEQFAAELAAEIAAALSSHHLTTVLEEHRNQHRKPIKRAPAEHWFGSHRSSADGFSRLGAVLADRVRNLQLVPSRAVKPKTPTG